MAQSLKIFFFLFLIITTIHSQNYDKSILSIDRIYGKREFTRPALGKIQWFDNGKSYTILEEGRDRLKEIVKYDSEIGERTVLVNSSNLLPDKGIEPILIYDYEFSEDMNLVLIFTNTKKVWRKNTRGDYWLLNRTTDELKKLGGKEAKPSSLMFATISPNMDKIAYVRENNIFAESVNRDEIIQLTSDGSETVINGTFDWVYEEEFKIRNGIRWNPEGNKIAFWQFDTKGIGVFNMINNTDSIYPKIVPIQYPKVGTINSSCRVGVVDLNDNEIIWFKIPGDSRNNYLPRMDWAGNSDDVIIQQLNRLQNQNKVYIGSAETGEVDNIFTDFDSAWVEIVNDIKWFRNGKYFTWLSEMEGWRKIYLISKEGKEIINITPGNYDVIEIAGIDKENETIYFIASPENPTQRYLYKKSIFSDQEMKLLTPQEMKGRSSYNIAPNFKWAIHTFSNINTPEDINFINLTNHQIIRNLISKKYLQNKIKDLNVNPIEFFSVTSSDGTLLDGWKILPPNFDKEKKYPAIFYVYGEPANQTVMDSWMRHYFWHQLLAQAGYVIISIDNRGTPAPRGKKFRKCIYGQIGILASADQADAVRAISKWEYIDEMRIGIWGWSGGGSMSLNAIFRYPDIYKTAIAVAPVADQKFYDTIYQERYMGLPSTNPEGYYNGSPINFAHQLKGNLLLIHGTGDDNVHYQNSELLINKLIENNKSFSVMPYPNRSHGIYEGRNTSVHLYETMLNYFLNNL